MSVSNLSLILDVKGKFKLKCNLKRHLAPALVGKINRSLPLNGHSHILEKSARIIGVGGDDISQYYPSIRLLEKNIEKLPWHKIISHQYQIEQVHEAMDVAMSDNSMKVLLNP